eukprot:scaffold90053_cov58-Phaeocystis_antarctica.AAC.2
MHEDKDAAGWGGGGSWQWEGRRCSSARQALAASSSSVIRKCRLDAELSRGGDHRRMPKVSIAGSIAS